MTKFALCINRTSAPTEVQSAQCPALLPTSRDFFYALPTVLLDRALCETDESKLQLLPYITIVSPDNTIFVYRRGEGGGEQRLHNNLSIGVGGHVDSSPPRKTGPGYDPLLEHLQIEAAREIDEELAINVHPKDLEFTHYIVDPTNPVGRVHLGLLGSYSLNQQQVEVIQLEANNIEDGQFVDLAYLTEVDVYNQLEPWSKLVVDYMVYKSIA